MSPRAVTEHPFHAAPAPHETEPAKLNGTALTAVSSIVVRDGVLTVKGYRGDGCLLIAMDLDKNACDGLAGFAIARSTDGVNFTYTRNRLSFKLEKAVLASTTTEVRYANSETSDIAPFQKFRWVDYPPVAVAGPYTYRVDAMYFVPGQDPTKEASTLEKRASVTFTLPLMGRVSPSFDVAFTRGYISSQAFAERYPGVRALRPDNSVDYNTGQVVAGTNTNPPITYKDMYRWLGALARQMLSDFLVQCEKDGVATGSGYDVFAYDLDEPDFIRVLMRDAERGWPIRLLLDNSTLHTKPGAREILAADLLGKSKVQIKRGHFHRYAHDKCVIQRDKNGDPVRVLTGSANFSVRGLYVQSNSMITVDDVEVAKLYGQAFDEAWNDMSSFATSEIAAQWFEESRAGMPHFFVSFAPHKTANVSLDRVAEAIRNAKSSVLFAVMELGGKGDVLQQLSQLTERPDVFSYGVTQSAKGLTFTKSGKPGLLVPFAFLKSKVPEPFQAEWNGGMGQVIHHKFVVVDFNGPDPVVFCGSSNLAEGGEESNGDNLLAIYDPAVASLYAVEAIKLVDHYEFRAVASQANSNAPLLLKGPAINPPWWSGYYDPNNLKSRERQVLVS